MVVCALRSPGGPPRRPARGGGGLGGGVHARGDRTGTRGEGGAFSQVDSGVPVGYSSGEPGRSAARDGGALGVIAGVTIGGAPTGAGPGLLSALLPRRRGAF